MPWIKNTDNLSEDPLVLRLCAKRSDRYELVGVIQVLREYAGRYLTNGFLPSLVVDEVPKRLRTKLTPTWIHRRGDACECMKDVDWPDDALTAAFFVHGYLADNPTRDEFDLRKAKRAECANSELRRLAMARDSGHCRYCDRPVNAFKDHTSDRGAVLDHVDPMRAIGIENLVIACRQCNSLKGNRTPEQAGMTLLQPRSTRESSEASNAPSNSSSSSSSSSSATAQADASTTPRAGRDGTGRAAGLLRSGRDNPYHRNDPDPDHHAGLPPGTWPPGSTKTRPGQQRASPEQPTSGQPRTQQPHSTERRNNPP